jgi:hypothetical protein
MGLIAKIDEATLREWFEKEIKRQEAIGAGSMAAYNIIKESGEKMMSDDEKSRLCALLDETNSIIKKYNEFSALDADEIIDSIQVFSEKDYKKSLEIWESLDDLEKVAYNRESMRILRGLPDFYRGADERYSISFIVTNRLWRMCGMLSTYTDFTRPVYSCGKNPTSDKVKESIYEACVKMLQDGQGYKDTELNTSFTVPARFIEGIK